MHRNFRNRSVREEVDPPQPTEVWLFAQELLGNPVPRVAPAEAEARRQRAELEWLASFSTRHEEELQRLRSAEAAARADRELLEFLADISTEHEDKLREVLREEAELRESQERVERFHQRRGTGISHVQEAGWDASKHPRAGSPPNPGWWASTGGHAMGTFASQKAKKPLQNKTVKEGSVVKVENFKHHDSTPEQRERFHRLLDDLAGDNETLAGSLARAAKRKALIEVHWTVGLTATTRGGTGEREHRPLTIFLEKNSRTYASDLKDVELDDVDEDNTAQIVIGHELGHAILGLQDPTKDSPQEGNVTLVENPLREKLGVKRRKMYNNRPIPLELPKGNRDATTVENYYKDERQKRRDEERREIRRNKK